MAQLDSSIILQGRQPQIESPVNNLAKMMQIQGMQQQNQLGQMKMDEARYAGERRNKLASLLQGQYETPEAMEDAVLRGGYIDEAQQLRKSRSEAAKAKADMGKTGAETEKLQLENEIKKVSAVGQILGGVRDQASYDQARAAAQQMGLPVNNMPPQFDPALVEQKRAQSLSYADQLAQTWKQKGYDLDVQKFGETKRSNLAGEGLQRRGQDITVRGQDMVDARGRQANDLKAREIDLIGQPASGGPVLGAPVPAVLPWANQSNPKDANKVKALEQSRGAKEIEKDIDAARKERDAAAQARRFIELNEKTATGGLVDRMGITRGLQSLGPEYAEMEAITAKLAPAMRVEGSGSTSDFDGKQFERATVGVDKPKSANKNIAQGVIARAQQAEEYADFRQTYLEQNGTLQGADRFWKDYANKNPIFDPEKAGTFELNAKRKPWKEHFKTQPVKGGPSPKPSPNMGDGGVVDFGSLK